MMERNRQYTRECLAQLFYINDDCPAPGSIEKYVSQPVGLIIGQYISQVVGFVIGQLPPLQPRGVADPVEFRETACGEGEPGPSLLYTDEERRGARTERSARGCGGARFVYRV